MKIAAYVNKQNEVTGFYDKGSVGLYDQQGKEWGCVKEIPLELNPKMGILEVRIALKKMVADLEDCRIFMAKEVKGVPYTILDGLGCSIWKSGGDVFSNLTFVSDEETRAEEEARNAVPKPEPVGDIRDCIYKIDLTATLAARPDQTSKTILIPFFKEVAFQQLDIFCENVPRWITPTGLGNYKLQGNVAETEGGFQITLTQMD